MKFRYTVETISRNGTTDVLSTDFDLPELILGRGSACNIIFDSNFVSLKHAKLTFPDQQLRIEDLGSLSGLKVNDKVVRDAMLREGDKVYLGDVHFTISNDGGIWVMTEERREKPKEDTQAALQKALERSDVYRVLPRIRYLSGLSLLLIGGWFFILPLLTGKQDSWSSGPISNNHKMIASDCKACHGIFSRVKDDKCLSCHSMTEHSEFLKEHPGLEGRCATCHMEHNGDEGLILRTSELCVNCHANIKSVDPGAKSLDVASFAAHPEFSIAIQPALPGEPFTRARLSDTAALRDNSNVKLNHEVHLKTLRGKDGLVKLDCRDCHNASPDLKTIAPITFEKHCESCHTLEFDDRLKGREVPHGEPDVVYKFLYAEYAKLLLSSNESPQAQATFNRFKPGGGPASVAAAPSGSEDFKRSFVEQQSRNAERQLFTKTACYLCHRIVEDPMAVDDANKKAVSKFAVLTPQIPERWMPQSIFSHAAHEAVRCDDCHKGVRESTKTNQVLLPRVEKCQTCHNDAGINGLVKSDCVMCHSYHDERLVAPDVKRHADEIIGKH